MRRKTCVLILAVVFVCLFASRAQPQEPAAQAAKAAWSSGYPKPGANSGEIAVQGTASASAGSTLTGKGTATVWPKGGGSVKIVDITVAANGNWSGTITGLESGTEYNIVIGIIEQNGCVQSTIAPDPGKSKAK